MNQMNSLNFANPPSTQSTSRLPPNRLKYPVIIPQRRPNDRERGFIRAYAPDLMHCGIDQATFIDFLDGFGLPTAEVVAMEGAKLTVDVVDVFLTPIAPGVSIGVEAAVESFQDMRSRQA